jgi:hypothetical protein
MISFEMMSVKDSVEWLWMRTAEYRSSRNDMGDVVDDFEEMGKLGCKFCSMDDLNEIDLGDEIVRRPTYVSANLTTYQKKAMSELLGEYTCCFA